MTSAGGVPQNGSAYGKGAPSYESAELQRSTIEGRLNVAIGIRDRAFASNDEEHFRRWSDIVDELLERLLEVRGR